MLQRLPCNAGCGGVEQRLDRPAACAALGVGGGGLESPHPPAARGLLPPEETAQGAAAATARVSV